MARKNPGPSSQPNAAIDLTPLLDVIFIFLFVVIIGYAMAAQAAETQAREAEAKAAAKVTEKEAEVAALSQEVDALRAQVDALNDKLFDQTAMQEAYEGRLEDYDGEVIGTRVKIVTVSCTYSAVDSTSRQIRVITPEEVWEAIHLTPMNQDTGYERLERLLETYIEDHGDAVIVLSSSSDNIQRRDKLAIDRILDGLIRAYDYVY